MITASTSADIQVIVKKAKQENKTIGFVPTMGALHQGHLSLVKEAKRISDYVVVSIFVNPTQFNNSEDFEKYPNTIENDLNLLKEGQVDLVFLPTKEIIYPEQSTLTFNFGYLENIMEGAFRPGHFNGVATVVSKLFNIVQPHSAFFGQKDIQQIAVIKSLVTSLSFPIKIEIIPTSRESSGLAMSSRNMRLSDHEKVVASEIYKSLDRIKNSLKINHDFDHFIHQEIATLEKEFNIQVEYLELVKANNLESIDQLEGGEYALCFAGQLGQVRLIDNLTFTL